MLVVLLSICLIHTHFFIHLLSVILFFPHPRFCPKQTPISAIGHVRFRIIKRVFHVTNYKKDSSHLHLIYLFLRFTIQNFIVITYKYSIILYYKSSFIIIINKNTINKSNYLLVIFNIAFENNIVQIISSLKIANALLFYTI